MHLEKPREYLYLHYAVIDYATHLYVIQVAVDDVSS